MRVPDGCRGSGISVPERDLLFGGLLPAPIWLESDGDTVNSLETGRALARARVVISPERAREILRRKNWEHGMCGCLNAAKPNVPPLTEEESRTIREVWDTLPGSSSWMSALYLLLCK